MASTSSPESTAYAFDNPPLHQALVLILFIPVIFIIVFGNTMVIAAAYKEPRLRTQSYIIFTSLAVSDLCIGLIATPLELYSRVVQDEITCSVAKSGYFTACVYTSYSMFRWHILFLLLQTVCLR